MAQTQKKSVGDKSKRKVLRLIDANFNRAKEGLRVCEDVTRFILNDAALSQSLRKLRHECSSALKLFPFRYDALVSMRDSLHDVGKRNTDITKRQRNWMDLIIQNMKRSQESFRVLEEVSKIFSMEGSRKFQTLRFQLYELEKRVLQKF